MICLFLLNDILTDGRVSFRHYINQILKKVAFNIINLFLKKEFDSINNYFPKILKTDKFLIRIKFEHSCNAGSLGRLVSEHWVCIPPHHLPDLQCRLIRLVHQRYRNLPSNLTFLLLLSLYSQSVCMSKTNPCLCRH